MVVSIEGWKKKQKETIKNGPKKTVLDVFSILLCYNIIDSIDGKLCSPDLLTVDTRALFNSVVIRPGGSKKTRKKR